MIFKMAPRLVRLKESGVSVITQARPRPGFSLHFRAGKIATLAAMMSCGLCSFMNFMSYGVWFRSVTVGIQVPEQVLTHGEIRDNPLQITRVWTSLPYLVWILLKILDPAGIAPSYPRNQNRAGCGFHPIRQRTCPLETSTSTKLV